MKVITLVKCLEVLKWVMCGPRHQVIMESFEPHWELLVGGFHQPLRSMNSGTPMSKVSYLYQVLNY